MYLDTWRRVLASSSTWLQRAHGHSKGFYCSTAQDSTPRSRIAARNAGWARAGSLRRVNMSELRSWMQPLPLLFDRDVGCSDAGPAAATSNYCAASEGVLPHAIASQVIRWPGEPNAADGSWLLLLSRAANMGPVVMVDKFVHVRLRSHKMRV